MTAPHEDHVSPARGPVDRPGLRLPDSLHENLQLIADGVVAVAGFEAAAIRIRRGDDLVWSSTPGGPRPSAPACRCT